VTPIIVAGEFYKGAKSGNLKNGIKNHNREITPSSKLNRLDMKHIKTYRSFKINENLTAQGKEMILNIFSPVTVEVDIENGTVTNFNGDEIEREGIYSFSEENFERGFEPFKKAGVKVTYTPWRSEGGDDYEGSYSIDVQSLNDAIKNGKITIVVDPEDPEEYIEIKN
jgi:hypothetical protein